jgi:hypothetical protein
MENGAGIVVFWAGEGGPAEWSQARHDPGSMGFDMAHNGIEHGAIMGIQESIGPENRTKRLQSAVFLRCWPQDATATIFAVDVRGVG